MTLPEILEDLERQLVQRTYDKTGGVKTETARLLGIKTSALYYKLEKYGIGAQPARRARSPKTGTREKASAGGRIHFRICRLATGSGHRYLAPAHRRRRGRGRVSAGITHQFREEVRAFRDAIQPSLT